MAPMFITTIRRTIVFGAIAGAVLVVALIAIAGFFVVLVAGTAGAVAGAALGLVVGIPRAVLKAIAGDRSGPVRPI